MAFDYQSYEDDDFETFERMLPYSGARSNKRLKNHEKALAKNVKNTSLKYMRRPVIIGQKPLDDAVAKLLDEGKQYKRVGDTLSFGASCIPPRFLRRILARKCGDDKSARETHILEMNSSMLGYRQEAGNLNPRVRVEIGKLAILGSRGNSGGVRYVSAEIHEVEEGHEGLLLDETYNLALTLGVENPDFLMHVPSHVSLVATTTSDAAETALERLNDAKLSGALLTLAKPQVESIPAQWSR